MERIGDALTRVRVRGLHAVGDADLPPDPAPTCPVCRDFGFVRHDVPLGHPDFGRAFACVCRDTEVRDRLRRRSNLGPLGRRTFASFSPEGREPLSQPARQQLQAALDACRMYADIPQGWLLLVGPSGCGKTHLAAAIANRQIELGNEAFFAVVPDLLDHLRASFAPSSDVTYDELFESIRSAKLLILDDLGTQSASTWAQEKLFQLFNHRFNAELPTVITSNHRLGELDERLRARLEDRLVTPIVVRTWDSPIVEALLGEWARGLQQQRFENFECPTAPLDRAHEIAWQFAAQPEGWLVLVGQVGAGKTHLAAAIKNQRDQHGEPTLFMTVPDLLDYLRATYAPSSDVTYDRGFDAVRNAPVLILDDYGAHSSTPWAEEKLFQLLNHRFNDRLPTVITTNLPLDQPAELQPGQQQELRIFSRLVAQGFSRVMRLEPLPSKRPGIALREPPSLERRSPRRGGTKRG